MHWTTKKIVISKQIFVRTCKACIKQKRFFWNFELYKSLLDLQNTHLECIEEEITFKFMHEYSP